MSEMPQQPQRIGRSLLGPFLIGVLAFLLVSNVATYMILKGRIVDAKEGAREFVNSAQKVIDDRVEAAAAQIRIQAASGALADVDETLGDFRVLNAHDHLFSRKYLDKYFAAAARVGVARTLFVASSDFTLKGSGFDAKAGNAQNTQEILNCEREFPNQIITYCTLHPDDPDKTGLLKGYMDSGVHGVKLYTGHSNFADRPLDAPEMEEVYAFCEANNLPICWHVNLSRAEYMEQFKRVMEKHPKMKVIIPHFGVTFYRPGSPAWNEFWALLDQYPGLYTDCSWGTRQILVHGLEVVSANADVFREMVNRYQDRVLWGTDMVVTGNQEKTEAWIASVLRACRDMLEKEVYYFWMAADGSPYDYAGSVNPFGKLRGLKLSEPVLRKIYETNYESFVALKP